MYVEVPRGHCHDMVTKLCNTVYTDNCKTVSRGACEDIPEQVFYEVCKDVPDYTCSDVTHEVCKEVSGEMCADAPMELGKDVIGKMAEKDVDDYTKYFTNSGYQVEIPIVKQSKKKAFTKSYTKRADDMGDREAEISRDGWRRSFIP